MAAASPDVSMFQQKYNEFVEDLRGTLPEYEDALSAALVLSAEDRLTRFQQEVKTANMFHEHQHKNKEVHDINPRRILPGVELTDAIWMGLSENTQKAIWEHTRVLSICCLMEAGFSQDTQPKWVEDAFSQAMKDVQDKMKSTDLEGVLKTFMTYFQSMKGSDDTDETDTKDDSKDAKEASAPKKGLFENGFPSLPEKFMKGHLARLAQEIVKDITPADLGITAEQLQECEKDPSRAIHILFSTFTERPDVIQKVVAKIGKRLQQKVASGSIRPQEIAREAEEMMKEFSENSSFVDMMENIKRAFGMEDMDIARKTGNEGSARMSLVRDRLRRKLEKKKETQAQASAGAGAGQSAAAKGKSKK
jgi:hypothetical protein